ncbi:BnaC02g46180D [Brassica napus]|uniref:(rape) hypothetical protein n=1 Tax=Brassica napus TaxID=3708 RepID=A0A078IQL8_BRANA|nr:unnamed protein product [Brassica napus]CDY51383.1 BnaC02g46180D [Brassica napus]
MLQRQSLVENLSSFVDTKPPKRCSNVAAATESTTTTCMFPEAVIGYPEFSDEPNSHLDKSVLCRICVRLPDGRRVQKSFLKSESVQLLLSFCNSQSQIDQAVSNDSGLLQESLLRILHEFQTIWTCQLFGLCDLDVKNKVFFLVSWLRFI